MSEYRQETELRTSFSYNFDLLVGLDVMVVYSFYSACRALSVNRVFAWNLISLRMLLNIPVNAVMALPSTSNY